MPNKDMGGGVSYAQINSRFYIFRSFDRDYHRCVFGPLGSQKPVNGVSFKFKDYFSYRMNVNTLRAGGVQQWKMK